MTRERTITRTCRSCGNPHTGSPLELLEGAQCQHCKALLRPITEPFVVDKPKLEAIAASLLVPVLVDVNVAGSAEDRAQHVHLERVARKLEGRGMVVKLDADGDREAAWSLGVTSTPTLVILKKQAPIFAWEGFADASLIEEWMRQAYRM